MLNPKEAQANTEQKSGVVKWFRDDKGYGFITLDGMPEDIMVHFSDIQSSEEHRTLRQYQAVTFVLHKRDRGFYATRVRAVNSE